MHRVDSHEGSGANQSERIRALVAEHGPAPELQSFRGRAVTPNADGLAPGLLSIRPRRVLACRKSTESPSESDVIVVKDIQKGYRLSLTIDSR
jgi:hypothetical protein